MTLDFAELVKGLAVTGAFAKKSPDEVVKIVIKLHRELVKNEQVKSRSTQEVVDEVVKPEVIVAPPEVYVTLEEAAEIFDKMAPTHVNMQDDDW